MMPVTFAGAGAALGIAFLVILYIVLIFGSIAFFIIALIDIVKRPDWQWKLAGQEKILWLLLVILINFLAIPSLIYWFSIRKKLVAVERAAAVGQLGAGHMTYGGWEPTPHVTYASVTPPSWQADPHGQHRWRWWDGAQWTAHVSDGDSAAAPTAGDPPPSST
jgi:hypothetical protein